MDSVDRWSSELLEQALDIAWVYLQRTGDLGNGNTAAVFLTDAIDQMIRQGGRNRMFLANKALNKYQTFLKSRKVIPIRENA